MVASYLLQIRKTKRSKKKKKTKKEKNIEYLPQDGDERIVSLRVRRGSKREKKKEARLTRDKSGPTRGTLERGWKRWKKRGSSVSMAIFRIGDLRNNNDPCARWWRPRLWVQGDDSSEKDGPLCRLTRGERSWRGG